jgi:glutamate/tyrosine decarboxylase-like PLP-dependent enzyme
MSIPLICSAVLLREKGILESACSGGGGAYLFHADENADYNFGQKSLQCGRRVDSLKFWMDWRSKGTEGYRQQVNHSMELVQHCCDFINQHPQMELLVKPDYLNVFFRYVPSADLAEEQLAELNLAILSEMKKAGSFYVDYSTLNNQFGIRLVISNNKLQQSHLDALMAEIIRIGEELSR